MTYRWLLGVALSAALLPAVGQAQETPKRGGNLIFAVNAEPPNYDCHANTSFAFIHPVRPHYSTLLMFDAPNYPKVVGDLADSWTVAPDGLTYTFKLKSNVKFHDGSALTSADVKASYDRIIKPATGVISVRSAEYDDVAAVEAPDPQTVVFKLKAPNASMLQNFASPWNCIYSAEKLKADPKWPEKNVMGTGPFTFGEHVTGSHWSGKRFEGYFKPGQPYLDSYRAVFMSGSAIVNALQGNQIMAEFRGFSPAERDKLVQAMGDKAVVQESSWVCKVDVIFNLEKKPFDDARVRRALSLAIDRWQGSQALSKIALVRDVGGAIRPGHPLAATDAELAAMPGFSKDINKNRNEARDLLKQAGQEKLTFKLTNRNVPMPYTPVGVFVIDQWRRLGLTVEHEQLETRIWNQQMNSGNYSVGINQNCDYMDEPNIQLLNYLSKDRSPLNLGHYTDRTLDDLFDKQKRVLDAGERKKLIRSFEQRLFTEAYVAPLIWWHRIIVHNAKLKGWVITPSHYLNQDLASVWLTE
jgi:peptide/nickel transport system substrate-binding protein